MPCRRARVHLRIGASSPALAHLLRDSPPRWKSQHCPAREELMRRFANRRAVVFAVFGSAVLLGATFCSRSAWSQDARPAGENNVEGVSVLARGPVHEAFADPAVEKPVETITAPKEPPAPVEELPPTEKPEGDNVQWIPGYWAWDQDLDDFIWVSGVWRDIPPGREWVPGYWT